MDIHHFEGLHFSIPRFPLPTSRVRRKFMFTPSCVHIIRTATSEIDEDQWDYSKLTGIDYTRPFGPRCAAMVGWRFNPTTELFELAAYVHDLGERYISEPLLSVAANETVEIWIDRIHFGSAQWAVNGLQFWITRERDNFSAKHYKPVAFTADWGREVNGWFGGNKPAPHRMTIKRF